MCLPQLEEMDMQDNSGFHYVRTEDNNGTHVSSVLLDNALPIDGSQVRPWKYDQCVYGDAPQTEYDDIYYYTHDDLMELTGWTREESVKRARKGRWRYRVDPTTKVRGYYLYDILATDWEHVLSWRCTQLEQHLLADALA
jgi:hypothetical protein